MLFNEPKLLKFRRCDGCYCCTLGFSALQRAEIAEIANAAPVRGLRARFSALQRAEIAEIRAGRGDPGAGGGFSALQRAEIAEMN